MINILYLHAGAEMYGADKVLLDLITHLDRSRFTPWVILPTDGVLVEALRRQRVHVMVVPYPIMRRKYFNPKGVLAYGRDYFRYSEKLCRIAARHHIDLIHCNTAATVEGCYVARRLHIPLMWCIHEIIETPRIMYRATSAMIAAGADLTVTVSEAARQHLLESGYFKNKPIRVVHNGVDSERFSPQVDATALRREWGIPDDALVIGMIGRVNRWKGQRDFLQAEELVMAEDARVWTVFAGSAFAGEEWREKELQEAIDHSPYRDRIVNSGYRKDSEVVHRLIDIFVLPSTSPDPLPTVVLEAMATGNPVVGYRHGGICEMVRDGYNGLLAEVNDPQDLAAKILRLVRDEDLRAQMGRHSRKRLLCHFSMERYVERYERLYLQLCAKNEE